MDRELFAELGEFFTEKQIVELGWATVSYMAFGRLIHVFGLQPEGAPAPS